MLNLVFQEKQTEGLMTKQRKEEGRQGTETMSALCQSQSEQLVKKMLAGKEFEEFEDLTRGARLERKFGQGQERELTRREQEQRAESRRAEEQEQEFGEGQERERKPRRGPLTGGVTSRLFVRAIPEW